MTYVLYFFLWTFMLYWLHRIAHKNKLIRFYHFRHHALINKNIRNGIANKWHWNNLFLWNDDIQSTIDLWLTEVIPTILFSFITGQWWISIFYYVWAAMVQETIEHNININYPLLLSGRKHLIHHTTPNKNYGLFFPVWDKIFKTYQT